MQEKVFHIGELIHKKLQDSISADEERELNEWINSSAATKKIFEQLNDETFVKAELEKFDKYNAAQNKEYLLRELKKLQDRVNGEKQIESLSQDDDLEYRKEKSSAFRLWKRIAVAASVIGVLFFARYIINQKNDNSGKPEEVAKIPDDIQAPDKNRAQIKLADGSIVYLDSVGNGALAQQGSINIVKTADGKIEYSEGTATGSVPMVSGELVYNTLNNPRGSKVIDMQLADGSHVWLNAGSSVTYPVAFAGNERKVAITGEAYFEVEKNAAMPFIVAANGMDVKVLGTHFNVNAYDDEEVVKTTLLEGSVMVEKNAATVLLKPGQQAQLAKTGTFKLIRNADVDEAIAWKNGSFYFNEADIQTVLRQVARWYDVEVIYEGRIPEGHYKGKPSRNLTVSQILKIVEYSGVKFKVEGRKIIIKE